MSKDFWLVIALILSFFAIGLSAFAIYLHGTYDRAQLIELPIVKVSPTAIPTASPSATVIPTVRFVRPTAAVVTVVPTE